MSAQHPRTDERLQSALAGDESALAELFEFHRGRLRRMLELRMHPGIQGRCDPSDVLQEAFIDAAAQFRGFARESELPFYLWLRLVTGQRLAKVHRQHLGTAKRDVKREISIPAESAPEASTFNLASFLAGTITSPSKHLLRDELRARIQTVLDEMEPPDREVLALRHFEELTIRESAQVLGITETAASSRYRRAILRIKSAMEVVPGLIDSSQDVTPENRSDE